MECSKYRMNRSSLRPTTCVHATRALFPRLILTFAIPIFLGGFRQACGGGGAPVTNLKSITIDPTDSSIAVGTAVQLRATGIFKNKTTKDLTDSVT